MKDLVSQALMRQHPSLKPYQATKAAGKYVNAILAAIEESLVKWGFENGDQLSVSLYALKEACGRMDIGGKTHHVSHVIRKIPDASLVLVDFEGNVDKYSRVSFNPIYKPAILDHLINRHYEMSPRRIRELANDPNKTQIRVDPRTLASYIEKTRITLREETQLPPVADPKEQRKRDNHINTLLVNLCDAGKLLEETYEQDGLYYVDEVWHEADSGRWYGQGISLQRVHKQVRKAALGPCHQYDFVAASYALMGGCAKALDPNLSTVEIEHYIQNRSTIRKALAQELGITEDRMKAVFTSLGFGAELVNTTKKSIRATLGYGEEYALGDRRYEKLLKNDQFMRIKEAMDNVRAVICANFNHKEEFEGFGGKVYSPQNKDGLPRSKDQMLAWIYQNLESFAVSEFQRFINEASNNLGAEPQIPLLWTHDCLFFKEALSQNVLGDAVYQLKKQFPLLDVDHEASYPIREDDFQHDKDMEKEQMQRDHAQIRKLESAKHGDTKVVPHVLDMHSGVFAAEIAALHGSTVSGDLGKTWRPSAAS